MRKCVIQLTFVMIATLFSLSPTITLAEEKGGTRRSSNFWPTWSEWKMPTLVTPKLSPPKEPEFLKSTRIGFARAWEGTKRSTLNAWNATKETLRPYDQPDVRRSKSMKSSGNGETAGFWANLFGDSDKPKRTETVNDFLRQPMIY